MSEDQWWAADPIATGKGGKPITVPGGASSAKPTEDQAKSASFYSRALGSNQTIDDLVKTEPDAFAPRGLARQALHDTMPGLENTFVNTAGRQKADAATREFVAATLRRDSGAAITPQEFEDQYKIYFPMPGDGKDVIGQKAQARQRAIDGLKIGAGPLAADAEKSAATSRAAAPAEKPPAILDPEGVGDIGFADRAHDEANSLPQGAQDFQRQLADAINSGQLKTADDVVAFGHASKLNEGRGFDVNKDQAQAYFDYVKKGGTSGADVKTPEFQKPDISADRGAGGVAETGKSFLRGIPNVVGIDDELAAVADTAQGGTLRDNLAKERAIRDYDEEHHWLARDAGTLAAAFAIPTGAPGVARAAGIEALRGGEGMVAARAAARQAFAQRSAAEGAGLAGAYGIGSSDGNIGDRLVSGGVDAVTGAATAYGLTRLGQAAGRKFPRLGKALGIGGDVPPKPPTPGQQVAAAAERQGVEVLPADVGGPTVGRITQGTYQSPYGAARIVDASKRSVESFKAARDRVAGEAAPARDIGETLSGVDQAGLDRVTGAVRAGRDAVVNDLGAAQDITGAGQIAQRGAQRFISESGDRASRLYDKIPIAPDDNAVVSNTRAALADMTKGMASNQQLSSMFTNPKFKAYLDALTPKPKQVEGSVLPGGGRAQPTVEEVGGKLGWSDMLDFRTRIGDMLDDPRLSENIAPRQLRALYGAVSRDMEATARGKGDAAYTAWKRANDFYDGRQKRVGNALSLLLGDRKDRTANEAYGQIDRLLRDGAGGNFATFGQIMRSLPPEDAQALRATLVSRAGETQAGFSPKEFAKAWGGISDRAKSYLLPGSGQRELMDQAATRALDVEAKTPLTDKSGEAVFEAVERMAMSKGDSRRFDDMMKGLSPTDATDLRGRLIRRMGEPSAAGKDDLGEGFSPIRFLTRWNDFTPEAKATLFGKGDLNAAMADLAKVANGMKAAARYANTSGSAGAISVDKTNGGLAGAVLALVTGHPIIAAGLASPAAIQNISSRLMTSPRMVRWLTQAAKSDSPSRSKELLRRLSNVATRDPAISSEIAQFEKYLVSAVNDNTPHAAVASDQKQQADGGNP